MKERGRWKRKGSRRDERVKEKRENWCAFSCYYAKKRACAAKRARSKERGKGRRWGRGRARGGGRIGIGIAWCRCGSRGTKTIRIRCEHGDARCSAFCACRWEMMEEIFIYDERSLSCSSSGRWMATTGARPCHLFAATGSSSCLGPALAGLIIVLSQ